MTFTKAFTLSATTVIVSAALFNTLVDFPPPLDKKKFPITAKIHILASLYSQDIESLSKNIGKALDSVLSSGYGETSPQATSLRVYAAQKALQDPKYGRDMDFLLAAHEKLVSKPHIGIGAI